MSVGGRGAARNIGLNLLFVEPGATGGMEIYARELAAALGAARPDARVTLFVNRELSGELDGVRLPTTGASRLHRVVVEQSLLPRAARRAGVQILHSLASTGPLASPGVTRVLTVHDVIFLTHPEAHAGPLALGLRTLVPLAARRAHRVVAVSEATARDVERHLHVPRERIDVVPNGPGRDAAPAPTPAEALRARFALENRRIVLAVSALRAHKNLARLIEAFARLEGEPVLVIAGYGTSHEAELRERASAVGVAARVRFTGWVDGADLEGLYREAAVMAFPSLAEGFGLPVLEAMRRGVPVACADATSLPEVAGDAALLFDPLSVDAMAVALQRAMDDPDLRAELAERGRRRAEHFSWEATAMGTWAAYDRALT